MKTNKFITTLTLSLFFLVAQIRAQEPAPGSEPDLSPAPTVESSTGTSNPRAPSELDGLTPQDTLSFNFRGAPLDDVLDYMSRAAGFVILREVDVQGSVDLWSHHPINRDEAVLLLNTVLNEKGYAAIRDGRVLKIVSRDKAKEYDIPVRTGNDPEAMEKSDEMVTQIIPVRYADATKLIENISELLPEYASISSNESSNAVVLTAPQTTVRRITLIIRALDTSISDISMIQVFQLKHSDATDTADLINKVFEKAQTNDQDNQRRNFMPPFMRGGRGEDQEQNTNSEARSAAVRVLAVADDRTNSVVVNAPDEVMPTIKKLVEQVDTDAELITEVRVINLKYADAEEMADIVEEVFNSDESSQQTNMRTRGGFFGRMMGPPMPPGGQQQQQTSERKEQTSTVVAVADTRTNSVIVSAVEGLIDQITEMVRQLDANSAKNQKVFVYDLRNANAETVAEILDEMFGEGTSSGSSRSSSSNTSRTGNTSSRTNSSSSSNRSSNSSFGSSSRN